MHGYALLALLALAAEPAPGPPVDPGTPSGDWLNPQRTILVRAERCGGDLCGRVVWASPVAEKIVADAGSPRLLGTELFRNFRKVQPNVWRGEVYVPDYRRTFHGTITRPNADTLVGRGCVLFGLICKSQTWTRAR